MPTVPMFQVKVQAVGPPLASPCEFPSSADQRTASAADEVTLKDNVVPLVTGLEPAMVKLEIVGPSPPEGFVIRPVSETLPLRLRSVQVTSNVTRR